MPMSPITIKNYKQKERAASGGKLIGSVTTLASAAMVRAFPATLLTLTPVPIGSTLKVTSMFVVSGDHTLRKEHWDITLSH